MSVTTNDTQQLGLGILHRIAVREKARLQAHFLSHLYQSPESDRIVLCGSMALHGVYLHRRWSKDLDFDVPLELSTRFPQIVEQCGLSLQKREGREGRTRLQDATSYTFSQPSAFFPEVTVGIETFSRERALIAPERQEFVSASGERLPISAKPLVEILATKLGCLFRRSKTIDFVDLWFGLSSDPCLRYPMREILRDGLCDAGDFSPPKIIETHVVLEKLSELEETWDEKLSIYLPQVPDFAQVQSDLSRWLPFFDTAIHE